MAFWTGRLVQDYKNAENAAEAETEDYKLAKKIKDYNSGRSDADLDSRLH